MKENWLGPFYALVTIDEMFFYSCHHKSNMEL